MEDININSEVKNSNFNFFLIGTIAICAIFLSCCFLYILLHHLTSSVQGRNRIISITNSLSDSQEHAVNVRNAQRQTDIQNIGKQLLQFYVNNNNTWPSGIPTLQVNTDPTGFNQAGNPDCLFSSVSATSHPGCEWVDDETLKNQLIPNYLASIPVDPLKNSHYFVALNPDKSSVIVITNSMEKSSMSNAENSSIYFKEL